MTREERDDWLPLARLLLGTTAIGTAVWFGWFVWPFVRYVLWAHPD